MGFLDAILKAFEIEVSQLSINNLVLKKTKKLCLDKCKSLIIRTSNVNFEIDNSFSNQDHGYEIFMKEESSIDDISVTIEDNSVKEEYLIILKKVRNTENCRVVFHLPQNIDIKAYNRNGNVKVYNVNLQRMRITTVNGNIKIGASKFDSFSIESNNGNIKIEDAISFIDANLTTQNGNIKVIIGRDACQIIANSDRGNIKLSDVNNDGSSGKKLTCTTNNGNIMISGF